MLLHTQRPHKQFCSSEVHMHRLSDNVLVRRTLLHIQRSASCAQVRPFVKAGTKLRNCNEPNWHELTNQQAERAHWSA